MCRAHNGLKETGNFSARRQANGSWTIHDNDGEPIG